MKTFQEYMSEAKEENVSNREKLRNYIFQYAEWIVSEQGKEYTQENGESGKIVPHEIYTIVKDIWDMDIKDNPVTNEYYQYQVDQLKKRFERTNDKVKFIEAAKNENRDFPLYQRFGTIGIHSKDAHWTPFIKRGREIAVYPPPDGFTFGDYVNELTSVYEIPDLHQVYQKFKYMMRGYANALFDNFLKEVEQEIISGQYQKEVERENEERQTAVEGFVYLNELGFIENLRSMNDISSEAKYEILAKILRVNDRTARAFYNNEVKYKPSEATINKVKDKISKMKNRR